MSATAIDPDIQAAFAGQNQPAPQGNVDPDIAAAFSSGPKSQNQPTADSHFSKALAIARQHPFTAGIGLGENALSAASSGAGSLMEAMAGIPAATDAGEYVPPHEVEPGSISSQTAYQPRTEAGKQIADLGGEEGSKFSLAYDKILGTGPAAQTVKERLPQAVGAVGTIEGIKAPFDLAESGARPSAITGAPSHPLAGAAEAETTRLGGVKSRMEENGLNLSPGKGEANQPVVDAIVRHDLGLPEGAPMTHDAEGNVPIMDAARALYAGPAYNEARAIPSVKLNPAQQKALGKVNPNFIPEEMRPNPDGTISGASAVDLSKLLRKSGSKMANSNQILNDGTEVSEMGADRLKAANALEDSVHDYYVANGRQAEADALYNARVYTAKTYSAEAALDGAGHVRVPALKQQTLRGKPLSGGIADLSQMGLQYPDAFKATPAKAAPGIVKRIAAGTVPVLTTAGGAKIGGPVGAIVGRTVGEHAADKILGP